MPCRRPCRSPQRCGGRRLRARTPISGRPPPRLRQPSRSRHADRSGTARPLHGIPSGRGLDPLRRHLLAEEFILGSNTRITRMGGLPLIGITSRSGRLCRPSPSRWRILLRRRAHRPGAAESAAERVRGRFLDWARTVLEGAVLGGDRTRLPAPSTSTEQRDCLASSGPAKSEPPPLEAQRTPANRKYGTC